MTPQELIKNAMAEQHLTYEDLMNRTGISNASINRYVNGKQKMSMDRVMLIASALGISMNDLLSIPWKRVMEGSTVFKVIGSVKCGYGGEPVEEFTGDTMAVTDDITRRWSVEDLRVLAARGSSMEKLIMPGDKLLVHVQQTCETNDICVVFTNDCEEATLKRIKKHEDGSLELVPENEEYPSVTYRGKALQNVWIYGKVISVIRSFV